MSACSYCDETEEKLSEAEAAARRLWEHVEFAERAGNTSAVETYRKNAQEADYKAQNIADILRRHRASSSCKNQQP